MGQVIGQIRVLQKIKDQIRFNLFRQKLSGIVYDGRKVILNRDDFNLEFITAVFSDTGNLGFTLTVFVGKRECSWIYLFGVYLYAKTCRVVRGKKHLLIRVSG